MPFGKKIATNGGLEVFPRAGLLSRVFFKMVLELLTVNGMDR